MIIVVIKNIGQFLPFAFSFLCNFQKHIYRILHFISLFLVVLGFYSQNLILEGPKLNYVRSSACSLNNFSICILYYSIRAAAFKTEYE